MNDLFGKTFECGCGKTHSIEPREVIYDARAVEMLPGVCVQATDGRRVAVFVDERTREVAGRDVCRVMTENGWGVTEVLVPDPSPLASPVCDDVTKEKLALELGDVDMVLPVGSGVLNDLGKWIAFDRGIPFAVFATAASMNGYASANVAPTLEGVKSLIRAKPPYAVAADPRIIADAPDEMTASGLGDILAKSVSSTDWYLNHVLFGDFYCARAVGLIEDIEPLYLEQPLALKRRQPEAVEALFQGLLLTGVAMTMAETSSPSSGGEHMIGHTLDMMSSVDGREHDLHGRQVGIGTVLASELYRRVLAVDSPELQEPTTQIDRPFWGKLADVVAGHYAEKVPRLRGAAESIGQGETWDRLREKLSAMVRPPEKTRDCLARAGAAHRAEHIKCSRERLLDAVRHAHEIRARFTILDLARLVGIMPDAAREIVESWA